VIRVGNNKKRAGEEYRSRWSLYPHAVILSAARSTAIGLILQEAAIALRLPQARQRHRWRFTADD
jgi:hypothetical protein